MAGIEEHKGYVPPESRVQEHRVAPEVDWGKLKNLWWLLPLGAAAALGAAKVPELIDNLQHQDTTTHSGGTTTGGHTSGSGPEGGNSPDWSAPDAQLHVLEQNGHPDLTDRQFEDIVLAHNPHMSRSDIDAIHHRIHDAGLDDRWVAANWDVFSHGQFGAGNNTVAHDHNIFDQHPANGDEVYHDGIDPQGYINFLKEAQDRGDSNPGLDSWLDSIDRMSQLVHERIHNDLKGDDRVVRVEPELFGHPVPTPGLPFTNDSITEKMVDDMLGYAEGKH